MLQQYLKFSFLISYLLVYATSRKFGLIADDDHPLSLLQLKTKALVEGPYAEVEYIQTYSNPHNLTLETEFYFPRTEDSIFYKFEATFRNQTIVGYIHEKEKAKEMYEMNKERGNTVAYSERNILTPDIMQIRVGNIPPNENVEIKFSIIQPLEVIVNKFWGFTLPSVVTQRYAPASVDPKEVPNITNVNIKDSSYKEWKIEVEIKSNKPFSYILNPSHNIKPELTDSPSGTTSKIYKAKWDLDLVPNKNFVVYFRSEELEEPSTILEAHPVFQDDYVLLTTFIPELNELNTKAAERTLETSKDGLLELKGLLLNEDIRNARGEFIFIIDRSGSMEGQRIENLKEALIQFLQTLPKDSFFNIISFGSSYSLYKPESIKYTVSSIKEATDWIASIDADMGGTEILASLKHLSTIPLAEGYPRTVMVLTDGDVFNPNEVINHVRLSSTKTRFCGVGIGQGASEYLIKNLAKAGRCTSQFVLDNENIAEKTIYMIKSAVSRYIEDINFQIVCLNDKQEIIYNKEEKMGILLKDQPFKKWTYLQNITGIRSCKAKVDYYSSMKKQRCEKEFEIDEFYIAERTETWHKVAYDAKIKDIDLQIKSFEYHNSDIEALKSLIVELSTKYQVMSDYTAFLAVLQENVVDPQTGRVKITIPNVNSADYHEREIHEVLTFQSSMPAAGLHGPPPRRQLFTQMKMTAMPPTYDKVLTVQNDDETGDDIIKFSIKNNATVSDSGLEMKKEIDEQPNNTEKQAIHGHLSPDGTYALKQVFSTTVVMGIIGALIGIFVVCFLRTKKLKDTNQQSQKKD